MKLFQEIYPKYVVFISIRSQLQISKIKILKLLRKKNIFYALLLLAKIELEESKASKVEDVDDSR